MQPAHSIDDRGNRRDKSSSVGTTENTVVATKVACCAEGGCRVGIAGDQASSHA
jgi:hypothetical protein